MLRLPRVVEVTAFTSDGEPVEGLLVSVATLRGGGHYYGDVIGLTDSLGEARLTRAQLLRHFEEDHRIFPMDYKVPLADCDPALEIFVRGGAEFRELKHASETNTLADQTVRALYSRARNELFETSRERLDLTGIPPDTARVRISVNRAP
jgi:hypothetical protein